MLVTRRGLLKSAGGLASLSHSPIPRWERSCGNGRS